MLQHEFPFDFLKDWIFNIVDDKIMLHFLCPARMIFASSVVLVSHVSLLELLHNLLQQIQRHFLFGIISWNFVCELDKTMEVLSLPRTHPGSAVDQRSLYHLQLLSADADQSGVYVFHNEVL
jgi:hypothetical protein